MLKTATILLTLPLHVLFVTLANVVLVESFLDITTSSDLIPQEARCLNCIRNVSNIMNIDTTKRCEGYFCGQFQLSYTYWAEAGKPGNSQGIRDFEKCAREKNCAQQTVRAYFKKFKRDCNNDGVIDCRDMAALHKAGPASCGSDWFYKSRYWVAFNKTSCMTNVEDPSETTSKSDLDEQAQQHQLNGNLQMKNQSLTNECLDCICDAVSGCNTSVNNCGSGTVCGPFAISQAYWKDGRRPGASWTACTRTKECSSVTIKNYMEKYKRDCNGDGVITCEDYAAIHRRGPRACINKDLFKDHYWNKFSSCRANQKPINDVNMVKVNEHNDETASNQHAPTNLGPSMPSTVDPMLATSSLSTMGSITTIPPPPINNIRSREEIKTINSATTTLIGENSNMPQTAAFELTSTIIDVKDDKSDKQPADGPSLPASVFSASSGQSIKKAGDDFRPIKRPEHVHDYTEVPSLEVPTNDQRRPLNKIETPARYPTSWSQTASTISTTTALASTGQMITDEPQMMDYLPAQPSNQRQNPNQLPATSKYNENQMIVGTNQRQKPGIAPVQSHDVEPPNTIQLLPSFPSIEQSQPPAQSDEVDYTAPDIPYPMSEIDRASSFDKVVNNIVGNPDFTKSYPPIPELVVQGNKPMIQQQHEVIAPHQNEEIQVGRNQPKLPSSINNSRGPNSISRNGNPDTGYMDPLNVSSGKSDRGPQTSSSQPIKTVTKQRQPQVEDSGENPSLIFGADNLNVTTLFEKGLNESSRIANECLECICDASSNCDTTVQCISKQREKNRCGLYMISWNQYQESDISLLSLASGPSSSLSEELADERMYYECATDRICAERLIHLYIEKHQKDCNNDGKIDCYDIAAIHRVGPDNCNSGKFLSSQYWRDFNICYTTDRLATSTSTSPAQPQPVTSTTSFPVAATTIKSSSQTPLLASPMRPQRRHEEILY